MPFKIFVLYYYIQILKKCQYRLLYAIFNNAAVGKNGSRAYFKNPREWSSRGDFIAV